MVNAFLHNGERARGAQFPLVGEIFLNAIKKHKPELAVIFTNLVAANMHRYWYGLFPQDYSIQLYPKSWVEKYKYEILAAMDDLDAYLKELCRLALSQQYTLLLAPVLIIRIIWALLPVQPDGAATPPLLCSRWVEFHWREWIRQGRLRRL